MKATSVNIRKLYKSTIMTVTLNIAQEFKIRIFIAKVLLKIIGLVLGCGIKVNDLSQKP